MSAFVITPSGIRDAIDNGHAADAVLGEQSRDILQRHLGPNGPDISRHEILDLHLLLLASSIRARASLACTSLHGPPSAMACVVATHPCRFHAGHAAVFPALRADLTQAQGTIETSVPIGVYGQIFAAVAFGASTQPTLCGKP